jgi:3-oxoacyl-[acyl-carrier protein] reductase
MNSTPAPGQPLAGRLALVTGAARGIGRAVATVLAEQGCDLVINDLGPEAGAAEAIAELRALGRFVAYHQADVGDEAAVLAMFESLAARQRPLDILVNNAGLTRAQTIRETSLADWESVLRVNLTGAFLCSRAAFAQMEPRRSGHIVNISSVAAHMGAQLGHVHYAASKSGLLGLTRTLARTGGPSGIRVNAVAPGLIDTELIRQVADEEGIRRTAAAIPLGLGRPRDVGLAVAFLCGEGGRYITGSVLDVNGGLYLH